MADSRFFDNKGFFTIGDIAKTISEAGIEIRIFPESDRDKKIYDVASLDKAGGSHISFLDNPKYTELFRGTGAGACIIRSELQDKAPAGVTLLITDNPYCAYAITAAKFYPDSVSAGSGSTEIHPSAIIEPDAEIGKSCIIGANSYIGRDVKIGNNVIVHANVSIQYAIIGNNVIIHNGVCIGQDGFGYAHHKGKHIKVPQLGRVIIEDDVEIGANSCIDRGSNPDTFIGSGSKIDNLVQIGHNVHIGRGCIIVSQVGISGSTRIGDYAVLGGQVGVAGHLTIGNGAQIAAQSGVTKNIAAGEVMCGMPAVPIRQFHRQVVTLEKISRKDNKNE